MNILKKFDSFVYEGFSDANIGIDDDKKNITVDFLNRLLSNEFVLFLKLWNFHWIIVGPKFDQIHKYFEDLYDKFFEIIDETAERIRTLGDRPIGTLSGYLDKTELKEYNDDKEVPEYDIMYQRILEDFEFIIREIRNFLDTDDIDNGTINFLEDLISKLEKDAWMIRSHIK